MRHRSPPRPGLFGGGATILALGALACVAAHGAEGSPAPVEAVATVDLDRYAGQWYEIARLPNPSRTTAPAASPPPTPLARTAG